MNLYKLGLQKGCSGAGDDLGHVAGVAVVRAPAGAVLALLPDAVNHRVEAVAALLKFPQTMTGVPQYSFESFSHLNRHALVREELLVDGIAVADDHARSGV